MLGKGNDNIKTVGEFREEVKEQIKGVKNSKENVSSMFLEKKSMIIKEFM